MLEDRTEEAVEDPTDTVTQSDAPAEPVAQGLTLNDLANIKQIIEVVSQRGAFRPEEMQVVGATYTRLVTFLQSIAPAQPEATEEEAPAETEAEA